MATRFKDNTKLSGVFGYPVPRDLSADGYGEKNSLLDINGYILSTSTTSVEQELQPGQTYWFQSDADCYFYFGGGPSGADASTSTDAKLIADADYFFTVPRGRNYLYVILATGTGTLRVIPMDQANGL